jgi:hypothetical protein
MIKSVAVRLPVEIVLDIRLKNAPLPANAVGLELASMDEAPRCSHGNVQPLRQPLNRDGRLVHDLPFWQLAYPPVQSQITAEGLVCRFESFSGDLRKLQISR